MTAKNNKTVFITGATAGIGKATAYLLAQNGYRLILSARREQRLKDLQMELQKDYAIDCYTLCFDVRDEAATKKALASIPKEFEQVDVLVNNAGLALGSVHVEQAKYEHEKQMMETNVQGVLTLCRWYIPQMKGRKSGHIINLGSIAGKYAYAGGAVYCATKFALRALTRALRMELLPYHIKVSLISPGAVQTEFSTVRCEGDTEKAKEIYEGYMPLQAEDIADNIFYVITRPKHVTVNDIEITCTAQANAYFTHKENS